MTVLLLAVYPISPFWTRSSSDLDPTNPIFWGARGGYIKLYHNMIAKCFVKMALY